MAEENDSSTTSKEQTSQWSETPSDVFNASGRDSDDDDRGSVTADYLVHSDYSDSEEEQPVNQYEGRNSNKSAVASPNSVESTRSSQLSPSQGSGSAPLAPFIHQHHQDEEKEIGGQQHTSQTSRHGTMFLKVESSNNSALATSQTSSFNNDKTPTARHFNISAISPLHTVPPDSTLHSADSYSRVNSHTLDDFSTYRQTRQNGAYRHRPLSANFTSDAASWALHPSPWDDPHYSQPPSPSSSGRNAYGKDTSTHLGRPISPDLVRGGDRDHWPLRHSIHGHSHHYHDFKEGRASPHHFAYSGRRSPERTKRDSSSVKHTRQAENSGRHTRQNSASRSSSGGVHDSPPATAPMEMSHHDHHHHDSPHMQHHPMSARLDYQIYSPAIQEWQDAFLHRTRSDHITKRASSPYSHHNSPSISRSNSVRSTRGGSTRARRGRSDSASSVTSSSSNTSANGESSRPISIKASRRRSSNLASYAFDASEFTSNSNSLQHDAQSPPKAPPLESDRPTDCRSDESPAKIPSDDRLPVISVNANAEVRPERLPPQQDDQSSKQTQGPSPQRELYGRLSGHTNNFSSLQCQIDAEPAAKYAPFDYPLQDSPMSSTVSLTTTDSNATSTGKTNGNGIFSIPSTLSLKASPSFTRTDIQRAANDDASSPIHHSRKLLPDELPDSDSLLRRALNSVALLKRIAEHRRQDASPLLVLDVRSLQSFVASTPPVSASAGSRHLNGTPHSYSAGPATRIKQSVNINFPTLLVKRFRKGNITSFNLESFITTPTGQQVYNQVLSATDPGVTAADGETGFLDKFYHIDICVVDEKLEEKDFATLSTTGALGAVLVDMLDRRRREQYSKIRSKPQGHLYYLDGQLSELLRIGTTDFPDLVASGSDQRDLFGAGAPSPGKPSLGLTPSEGLPTPTLASSSTSSSTKMAMSASDTSIFKVSAAKQRTRTLPQLSLPSSSSFSGLSTRNKGGENDDDTQYPSTPMPPPSPGLFRSQSESESPALARRKPRPVQLQRLDTSDRIKHPRRESLKLPVSNAQASSHRDSTHRHDARHPPSLDLAPPKSFQEICMAQSNTPTRSTFGGSPGRPPFTLGRRSDVYGDEPPPTPGVRGFSDYNGHSRNYSTESSSSQSQYASFGGQSLAQNSFVQSLNQKGSQGPDKDAVAPFNVSVIIPGFLYLGPEPIRTSDVEQLESVGIKRILNMAFECDTQERWKGRFEKIATIPMRDSLAEVGVQERIREACMLLNDADLYGKPTYVHCKAGKSRSVTIVLAYLIHRNHWPLKRAYAHVSERRKGVSPNIGFVAELMRFEEAELGCRSQGVLGSGQTPVNEHSHEGRYGYFRSHSKSASNASTMSTGSTRSANQSPRRASTPQHGSPQSARSETSSTSSASNIPTSLDGRPTIVRHLSLIANTAMNLTPDQAGSKGNKDAKALARNARVRDSLPPGVGFSSMGITSANPVSSFPILADEVQPFDGHLNLRGRSRTGLESAPPLSTPSDS